MSIICKKLALLVALICNRLISCVIKTFGQFFACDLLFKLNENVQLLGQIDTDN